MENNWTGKAVSIECEQRLGVFQGIIKDISAEEITIIRAFRNGVPLRKQGAEVILKSTDILKISLIPSYNGQSTLTPTVINKPTPVKLPGFNANMAMNSEISGASTSHVSNGVHQDNQSQQFNWSPNDHTMSMTMEKSFSNMKIETTDEIGVLLNQQQNPFTPNSSNGIVVKTPPSTPCNNSVAQFFGNMIPPKVEVRMGSAFSVCSSSNASANAVIGKSVDDYDNREDVNCPSKPIDILNGRGSGNGRNHAGSYNSGSSNGNGNGSGNGNGGNGSGSSVSGNGNGNGNGNGHNRSRNGNGGSQNNSLNGFSNGGGIGKNVRQQRKQLRRDNSMRQQNRAFATSVNDPLLNEDFDFEGNLALFDKQAIWNVIEAEGSNHAESLQPVTEKKYRHDENILVREPPQLRGIEAMFDGSTDWVTDEGYIIPTVPHFVRSKIEITADRSGLTFQRQIEILARGATDLAITILGGARRLTPNNYHQWPKVVILCEKSANYRSAHVGATTGRHLASHGIGVVLYLEDYASIEQKSNEIALFKATGNSIAYSVDELPTPDLVILSTNSVNLSNDVKKWLGINRASIFAIDPPASGIRDIVIKCSILPILPLNGISTNNCGKLYLCNLGLPEKFYRDAGVKYKSPFGHKFVIPIHPKH